MIIGLMLSLFLAEGAVAATEEAAKATVIAAVQCDVREEKAGQLSVLRGGCGQTPVAFGYAEKRQIAKNAKTGSTAVVSQSDGQTTIYVIRPSANGKPIIEDLTAELEAKAGGSGRGGLQGFTVDLSRFADEGVLSVAREGATSAKGVPPAQVSVVTMVEAEKARLVRPAPPLQVVAVVPEGKGPPTAPEALSQTFPLPRPVVGASAIKDQAAALRQGDAAK